MRKTIFLPSGDQTGSAHPRVLGSAVGPPHAWSTGIWRRPLPSLWTTQIVLWTSKLGRLENTIWLPLGDHDPGDVQHGAILPGGCR